MKHFKTLLLIAVLTLGFGTIQAQNKTAHINFQELVILMPEIKVMNDELAKLDKTQQDDLKAADLALKAKLAKYKSEAASQTEAENQKRQLEVQNDEQRLYSTAQVAQKTMGEKRNEKLAPIVEKAQKAINDVAKEKGIAYVFDSSTLLTATGTDLMADVKAKLGIQ
jgi:outer membrane protein|tara:strand:+ start:412 stop:912 length:501 start_codon:yes stop_codon:yes gene_type:complete